MAVKEGVEVIKEFLLNSPASPGVYRMIGKDGEALYVGKARDLKKRITSYTKPQAMPYRIQRMTSLVVSVEVTVTKSEAEALLLEANLIKKLQPKFNILLKDDKSFPYILLTSDSEYNMLLKHRGAKMRKGEYFGPFASAGMVNQTISALQRAFPLRSCTDNIFASRSRPCIEYQIKRCTGPCVRLISKDDYNEVVEQTRKFLRGKSHEVQSDLAAEMQKKSEAMEFEKAASIRDRIRSLSRIQAERGITASGVGNADVVALYREGKECSVQIFFFRSGQNYGNRAYFPAHSGESAASEIIEAFLGQFYQVNMPPELILISDEIENADVVEEALSLKAGRKVKIEIPKKGDKVKLTELAAQNAKEALLLKLAENSEHKKLLAGVAELFGLDSPPERIEVYDNSHIMGSDAVGAMIVVNGEGFDKKSYRKFNIKSDKSGDDFQMMREVLSRRFSKISKEWSKPDLVLIDGGGGQLSAVQEIMDEMNIQGVALAAISKGPDRNAGNEEFHQTGKESFRLPKNHPVLFFLQRVRDEAHRFAITGHRQKRSARIPLSELDEVPNIGAARKKALLAHFGGVAGVKNAEIAELRKVDGINARVAEAIYNHFH